MHELERLHQLIDNVFLVNLLQDVGSDNGMEVCFCGGENDVTGKPTNPEAASIAGV